MRERNSMTMMTEPQMKWQSQAEIYEYEKKWIVSCQLTTAAKLPFSYLYIYIDVCIVINPEEVMFRVLKVNPINGLFGDPDGYFYHRASWKNSFIYIRFISEATFVSFIHISSIWSSFRHCLKLRHFKKISPQPPYFHPHHQASLLRGLWVAKSQTKTFGKFFASCFIEKARLNV